ncbi:MAG TPA: TVP38/TMEM64 family protein [Candidatus Angelobacter sp.]|nr:TVP38/TMEM64 family protein [Candidatus Angelobacter sp.]
MTVLLNNIFPLTRWVGSFIQWVQAFGSGGAVIYGLFYVAGVVLFFPGIILTAGAGLLYGVVLGTLIVSPASVLGSTLAFLIARYVARDWVSRKLEKYPNFKAIDRAIEKNGFKMILLLRLQPVVPFNLLNYALGLTRIRLRDYVVASFLGMFPATVLYVYFGSVLHSVSDLSQGHLGRGKWGAILFWAGLAAAVVLVVYIGRIARKALQEEIGPSHAPITETPRSAT